jgi:hypothetical protein
VDVFACDTSYLLYTNTTIKILIHLPAFKEDGILFLYGFLPLPLPLADHPGRFLLPNP